MVLTLLLVVNIGLIDTSIQQSGVESKAFIPVGLAPATMVLHDKRTHGQASLDTILEVAPKAKVYHANIMGEQLGSVFTFWPEATLALHWLKEKGVKYVCMPFSGQKTPEFETWVAEANSLELQLVAPINNPGIHKELPYPASASTVIAVGPNDKVIKPLLRKEELLLTRILENPLAANSKITQPVAGTSFAAVRACAKLALKGK